MSFSPLSDAYAMRAQGLRRRIQRLLSGATLTAAIFFPGVSSVDAALINALDNIGPDPSNIVNTGWNVTTFSTGLGFYGLVVGARFTPQQNGVLKRIDAVVAGGGVSTATGEAVFYQDPSLYSNWGAGIWSSVGSFYAGALNHQATAGDLGMAPPATFTPWNTSSTTGETRTWLVTFNLQGVPLNAGQEYVVGINLDEILSSRPSGLFFPWMTVFDAKPTGGNDLIAYDNDSDPRYTGLISNFPYGMSSQHTFRQGFRVVMEVVPEPASWVLAAIGAGIIAIVGGHRRIRAR